MVKNSKWTASAPSNIALIKYMGKTDLKLNRPTNTSLSYTLPHLKSLVELEVTGGGRDVWEPLRRFEGRNYPALPLSEKGSARFLAHLKRLKDEFGFDGAFIVRSANDFPSDCGLASSASSFAALTKAAGEALAALTQKPLPSVEQAADLSRQGSGSSCRSFFAPWSIWDDKGARGAPELGYPDLVHQTIIVDDQMKSVSSSSAHVRVTTSELFRGRPERAEERVRELLAALRKNEWSSAFEITWAEFWDMHALFETSRPPFGYMTAGSLEALRSVRALSWEKSGDGPLVTMDAGPNLHLLYRREPAGLTQAREISAALSRRFKIVSNFEVAD